jgi:Cu-Zn family superoxide dismutase
LWRLGAKGPRPSGEEKTVFQIDRFGSLVGLAAGLALALPALAQPPVAATAPTSAAPARMTIKMVGPGAKDMGTATVTDAPKGVIVRLQLKGLTPGWHGMHFHEKGDCSAADFTSAGGHVHDMTPVVHGLLNTDANDRGDLPNIYAGADGTVTAEVYSTLVALKGPSGRPVLTDTDGSALVVHANADDLKTQPIGGAGARVACGVIK